MDLIKDIEKAPEDHDWSKTPIYLEYFQGFSETMSFINTQLAQEELVKIKEKKMELAETL